METINSGGNLIPNSTSNKGYVCIDMQCSSPLNQQLLPPATGVLN